MVPGGAIIRHECGPSQKLVPAVRSLIEGINKALNVPTNITRMVDATAGLELSDFSVNKCDEITVRHCKCMRYS